MTKKSWQEKLHVSNGLPKVETTPQGGTMVIPAPLEVYEIMAAVEDGDLITTEMIRTKLAGKHGTMTACPLVTGISVKIAAFASEDAQQSGTGPLIPYWRTLKSGWELNDKLPRGIEHQRAMLEQEGHTIIQKGKRMVVARSNDVQR